jgi:hypothetical protein
MTTPSTNEHQYVTIGLHYYVAGRRAYLNGFLPVTANLFHHGFEMLFKAILIRDGVAPADLKSPKFGHDLLKLWPEYKRLTNEPGLDQYDDVVNGLDHWEDIRYPGFPGGRSVAINGALLKEHRVHTSTHSPATTSTYVIVLEEMDELFQVIVRTFPLGPLFLRSLLHRDRATADYEQENRHQIPAT